MLLHAFSGIWNRFIFSQNSAAASATDFIEPIQVDIVRTSPGTAANFTTSNRTPSSFREPSTSKGAKGDNSNFKEK